MDRLFASDSDWTAPRLWLDEFVNVLCTYVRAGAIPDATASSLLEDAMALMDKMVYEIPPHRILSVTQRTQCSGYDSQYVALAEDLGLPLYTFDKKLVQNCPNVAVIPR